MTSLSPHFLGGVDQVVTTASIVGVLPFASGLYSMSKVNHICSSRLCQYWLFWWWSTAVLSSPPMTAPCRIIVVLAVIGMMVHSPLSPLLPWPHMPG